MQKVDLKVFIEIYEWNELSASDQALLLEAETAIATSYSPYSRFCVGAALLLEDGTLVKGSNQENAAFPSGLCAERTATFAAAVQHPGKRILAVAIVARPFHATQFVPISPCGACRQSLLEYEQKQGTPIRFLMGGSRERIYIAPSVASLLPIEFTADQLK